MTDPSHDFGKPPTGFRVVKTSLEPDTLDLGVEQTPLDRFFVCTNDTPVDIEPGAWRLTIDGDAVGRRVELTLDDLAALPQVEFDAWLECAGNGRRLYALAGGYERSAHATDTQWTLGGMGQARWGGVRLADVLALAEPLDSLAYVGPTGLDIDIEDDRPVRMCLPAAKALHPDTLIAVTMNDRPLTRPHGAPARLVVPGWVGAYSMKWLGHLECSTEWLSSWRADTYYRLRAPDGVDLGPATAHPVKSCLAVDWMAPFAVGDHRIQGYARSGAAPIGAVEWSLDGGPWQPAQLTGRRDRWTWTAFHIDVSLDAGDHEIRTRATDGTGATQPDSVPFHPNTILWNAVTAHPVRVG